MEGPRLDLSERVGDKEITFMDWGLRGSSTAVLVDSIQCLLFPGSSWLFAKVVFGMMGFLSISNNIKMVLVFSDYKNNAYFFKFKR